MNKITEEREKMILDEILTTYNTSSTIDLNIIYSHKFEDKIMNTLVREAIALCEKNNNIGNKKEINIPYGMNLDEDSEEKINKLTSKYSVKIICDTDTQKIIDIGKYPYGHKFILTKDKKLNKELSKTQNVIIVHSPDDHSKFINSESSSFVGDKNNLTIKYKQHTMSHAEYIDHLKNIKDNIQIGKTFIVLPIIIDQQGKFNYSSKKNNIHQLAEQLTSLNSIILEDSIRTIQVARFNIDMVNDKIKNIIDVYAETQIEELQKNNDENLSELDKNIKIENINKLRTNILETTDNIFVSFIDKLVNYKEYTKLEIAQLYNDCFTELATSYKKQCFDKESVLSDVLEPINLIVNGQKVFLTTTLEKIERNIVLEQERAKEKASFIDGEPTKEETDAIKTTRSDNLKRFTNVYNNSSGIHTIESCKKILEENQGDKKRAYLNLSLLFSIDNFRFVKKTDIISNLELKTRINIAERMKEFNGGFIGDKDLSMFFTEEEFKDNNLQKNKLFSGLNRVFFAPDHLEENNKVSLFHMCACAVEEFNQTFGIKKNSKYALPNMPYSSINTFNTSSQKDPKLDEAILLSMLDEEEKNIEKAVLLSVKDDENRNFLDHTSKQKIDKELINKYLSKISSLTKRNILNTNLSFCNYITDNDRKTFLTKLMDIGSAIKNITTQCDVNVYDTTKYDDEDFTKKDIEFNDHELYILGYNALKELIKNKDLRNTHKMHFMEFLENIPSEVKSKLEEGLRNQSTVSINTNNQKLKCTSKNTAITQLTNSLFDIFLLDDIIKISTYQDLKTLRNLIDSNKGLTFSSETKNATTKELLQAIINHPHLDKADNHGIKSLLEELLESVDRITQNNVVDGNNNQGQESTLHNQEERSELMRYVGGNDTQLVTQQTHNLRDDKFFTAQENNRGGSDSHKRRNSKEPNSQGPNDQLMDVGDGDGNVTQKQPRI